jgi:hypothetical protein
MLGRIINGDDFTIYTWHITETAEELAGKLMPFKDIALLGTGEKLGHQLWHNTHFLSTRILLYNYAGLHSPVLKNEFGKPFNSEKKISISHSNNYAAIIVSETRQPAIDLEKIDKRILRVQHKFIHADEQFFTLDENVIYTTLIWSSKETLYKFYSANEVIFKEELRIHPFQFREQGFIKADILKEPKTLGINIQYITFDNYVLTWCQ